MQDSVGVSALFRPISCLCVQLASIPQAEKTERLQWVHDMRSAFSPAAMLTEDGAINQEFFKPKQVFADSHAHYESQNVMQVRRIDPPSRLKACLHRWC